MKSKKLKPDVVTDDRGRQRFHGAFTGGFSAGHFNSVGTVEGFRPAQFFSSRSNRANQKGQEIRDFLDREDGLLGGSLVTKDSFNSIPENKKWIEEDGNFIPGSILSSELTTNTAKSIGKILLSKMGWKQGQGIGARVLKSNGQDIPPDLIQSITSKFPSSYLLRGGNQITYAPEDKAASLAQMPAPKDDFFGLGYDPSIDHPDFIQSRQDEIMATRMLDSKTNIKHQNQGVEFGKDNKAGGKGNRFGPTGGGSGWGVDEDVEYDIYDDDQEGVKHPNHILTGGWKKNKEETRTAATVGTGSKRLNSMMLEEVVIDDVGHDDDDLRHHLPHYSQKGRGDAEHSKGFTRKLKGINIGRERGEEEKENHKVVDFPLATQSQGVGLELNVMKYYGMSKLNSDSSTLSASASASTSNTTAVVVCPTDGRRPLPGFQLSQHFSKLNIQSKVTPTKAPPDFHPTRRAAPRPSGSPSPSPSSSSTLEVCDEHLLKLQPSTTTLKEEIKSRTGLATSPSPSPTAMINTSPSIITTNTNTSSLMMANLSASISSKALPLSNAFLGLSAALQSRFTSPQSSQLSHSITSLPPEQAGIRYISSSTNLKENDGKSDNNKNNNDNNNNNNNDLRLHGLSSSSSSPFPLPGFVSSALSSRSTSTGVKTGQSIRSSTSPWSPNPLLCKRFNIKAPINQQASSSSSSSAKSSYENQMFHTHIGSFLNIGIGIGTGTGTGTGGETETGMNLGGDGQSEDERRVTQEQNDGDRIPFEFGKKAIDSSQYIPPPPPPPSPPRPPRSLFKSIFESEDEDEDENASDDESEGEQSRHKRNENEKVPDPLKTYENNQKIGKSTIRDKTEIERTEKDITHLDVSPTIHEEEEEEEDLRCITGRNKIIFRKPSDQRHLAPPSVSSSKHSSGYSSTSSKLKPKKFHIANNDTVDDNFDKNDDDDNDDGSGDGDEEDIQKIMKDQPKKLPPSSSEQHPYPYPLVSIISQRGITKKGSGDEDRSSSQSSTPTSLVPLTQPSGSISSDVQINSFASSGKVSFISKKRSTGMKPRKNESSQLTRLSFDDDN